MQSVMQFKMAATEENTVQHPSEGETSFAILGSDNLMIASSSDNCEMVSSKPVISLNCTFESSEKENLMPLDLFSVYSSTSRPPESLGESGLFSMLGGNMIACSSEQLESYSSSEEEILSNKDLTLDKDEIARDLLRNEGQHDNEMSLNDLIDTFDMKTSGSSLPPCVTSDSASSSLALVASDSSIPSGSATADESLSSSTEDDLLPSSSSDRRGLISKEDEDGGDDGDDDEDDDDNDGVCVGTEHQAVIPDLLPPSSRCSVGDSGERLLWDPLCLPEQEVEAYCCQVLKQNQQNLLEDGVNSQVWSENSYIRDDEQALYLLLQCGYNVDEAVRRRQCEAIPPLDVMKLWTSEECENFEIGLRLYGKNFFEIRRTKFRTRSVKELVHFYYHWKKINRRKAKLLVGSSSSSNVAPCDLSSGHISEISPAQNYLPYEAPHQPQFHDIAPRSNYPSYDSAHSVPIQDYTQSPLAQSTPYAELKHQVYGAMPMTDPVPSLHWFGIDQDVCQSEMDFALASRPNFDAVSVMSGVVHALPVYTDGGCYGNQVHVQTLLPGQLYADGFPESCLHKSVFLGGQSGEAKYPMLNGDLCLDVSLAGQPPFKRFKSAVDYPRYDGYPGEVLLSQNPMSDRGFSLPVDAMPVRSCIAEDKAVDLRGIALYPSTNCTMYRQWLESPTLHG